MNEPKLTEQEANALLAMLKTEHMLVMKFQTYAQICKDPQIKTLCEQIAGQHQSHYDRLSGFFTAESQSNS